MKLLTKEILEKLPPLYAYEAEKAEDIPVVAKFFLPTGEAAWFATEYDPIDKLFFGFVTLGDPANAELGIFSLAELESIEAGFGLGVERDIRWTPIPLSEVMAAVKSGQRV